MVPARQAGVGETVLVAQVKEEELAVRGLLDQLPGRLDVALATKTESASMPWICSGTSAGQVREVSNEALYPF